MATDPVRARRRQVALAVKMGKRVGYLLWLAAIVLFFVALFTDLQNGVVAAATVCLIAGCVLLAPAIVMGYAVNAAERDDTARGL